MRLKKGDRVTVIAGKDRGATGTIVRAFPKKNRVVIDGVNVVKKNRRATAKNRKGQIVEKPMPIHASNVMLADPKGGKPTRIRIVRKEGVRQRVASRSGEEIK